MEEKRNNVKKGFASNQAKENIPVPEQSAETKAFSSNQAKIDVGEGFSSNQSKKQVPAKPQPKESK